MIQSIIILKRIPFSGEGDTLESRLKKVTLRGFPHIRIYEHSQFETEFIPTQQIATRLHTPQLRVYQAELDKVQALDALFAKEGVNICNLDAAYDYLAIDEKGNRSEWTLLPPVIERIKIPRSSQGTLDYTRAIGPELQALLAKERFTVNQRALEHLHTSKGEFFDLINDGSHRVHYGSGKEGIKIIRIRDMAPGFPYYATPQLYQVTVFATREEALALPETKIHVIAEPGHKNLYRLFPSGGIKSGDVRPDKVTI